MNKTSRIEGKKVKSKCGLPDRSSPSNYEGGNYTMLKIISSIFIFGFVFLNISNAPQKDWTDDILSLIHI